MEHDDKYRKFLWSGNAGWDCYQRAYYRSFGFAYYMAMETNPKIEGTLLKQKIYTFHVHGMHCHSCVLLTQSELVEHPKVSSVKSSLKTRSVEICGDFCDRSSHDILEELNRLLSRHSLSQEKQNKEVNWHEFVTAIPIALGFVFLFILLQKIGIVNLVSTSNVTYGTAFVIGVMASLSTCMAVVGGLVLSMSSTFAREGNNIRPQLFFHAGRLVSFFILGGVIGAVGSFFQFGVVGTSILGMVIGLVMLILGINLLDVFHWAKRFEPTMPKFFSEKALAIVKSSHSFTPLFIGVATFFLPCGFTQAMQIYTLSTGSFFQGALTMFAFALGTLPVLALISFSSLGIHGKSNKGIFFKSAGLIVIFFAIFNIINSMVAIGWIPPVFNF
ncbi:MAG: Uncharacterized protein G01um101418_808 [Parcubacteria group bacterium Gr01-1014_18]|nr:MAG: Uncharacterized protein Greene041636_690 [Parcubacteria group bacterium Greene0416_36]TSC80110.1 MAG: Uncharacterized protein G01um101418_808 [Parcubacteria group bacterium Gr01-1014_18]TSC98600.1 MAG: Uncharacterized protein Greene101420_652 [Parcubacteria group bacterium Greene1014_20]TSD06427.1 MAG: Uncharacterized protein Greene07142_918 [Parcubacteria group bacterium Greene0714_2]